MEKQIYAVTWDGAEPNEVAVVEAVDKTEALRLAIQEFFLDFEIVQETIYEKMIFSGVYSTFYSDEKGDVYDQDGSGNIMYRQDLVDTYGERINEDYIDPLFEKNVRAFFGEHTEWAELYLTFSKENIMEEQKTFPDDMATFLTMNDNGYRWQVVEKELIRAE